MKWTDLFLPLAGSFGLTFAIMPMVIAYFKQKQFGQEIREEGPEWHQKKSGTPTMGGVVFILAAVLVALLTGLWQQQCQASLWILIFLMLAYGLIGFCDDFVKVFNKRNLGLTSKQKFIFQVLAALIFCIIFYIDGFNTNLVLPFGTLHLGWFYPIFAIFWIVGFSNAVNLTDGLDGLVTGLGMISFGAYAIIAFKQAQWPVFIICIAVIGALLGFFPYNHKPAKIFMGDVGSLSLGALLAGISIVLHQEWTLLLIGFIYVIETLSVIIQVTVFRATGKRVFKMSPIHHHFEMCGWSEWKVDLVFWSINLILSILALMLVL